MVHRGHAIKPMIGKRGSKSINSRGSIYDIGSSVIPAFQIPIEQDPYKHHQKEDKTYQSSPNISIQRNKDEFKYSTLI
jgi:hypothetical protein